MSSGAADLSAMAVVGGLAVAVVGFLAAWTYQFWLLQLVDEELVEAVGRWLLRAGGSVAVVAAAVHLLVT